MTQVFFSDDAVESSATTQIPEWCGEKMTVSTEESAYVTEQGLQFFIPRQEKFYIIESGPGAQQP